MKTISHRIPSRRPTCPGFLGALLGLLFLVPIHARSVVAQWDFNGPDPGAATVGSGTWQTLGAVTPSVGSGAGSSDTRATGNLALLLSHFPSATNLASPAGIEFIVATHGDPIHALQLDLRGSATACRHVRVESSTDGGASYQPAAPLQLTHAGSFENGLRVELHPETVESSPAEFRLRLTATPSDSGVVEGVSGDYGASGTWRLDNVTFLTGSTSPDPIESIAPPLVVFTNRIRSQVHPGEPATNAFAELALRPGESLHLEVSVHDTNNRPVTLRPGGTPSPTIGAWTVPDAGGSSAEAWFDLLVTEAHAGHAFQLGLVVDNGQTQTVTWTVYVPTRAERGVILEEFLANPPTGMAEFVELVNSGTDAVDLAGWTLGDAASVRHRFGPAQRLGSHHAVVVWGDAPPGAAPPNAEFLKASSGNLSLNNAGDTLVVRNARSNLVERIVYRGASLARTASLARERLPDGDFHPHPGGGSPAWSPGEPTPGVPWDEEATGASVAVPARCVLRSATELELRWEPVAGRPARILTSPGLGVPFVEVRNALTDGTCIVPATEAQSFYRVEWH